jgi:S1-C subfamily serine protease
MRLTSRLPILLSAGAVLFPAISLLAQAPGVKIVRDRGDQFDALVEKANALRAEGGLLSMEQVNAQLSRTSCELKLPKPSTKKLSDREIWQRSQAAHVRVGWHYLCNKCSKWHQNLAGGYFITADGIIATCHHVVKPAEDFREGYLVAGNEEGQFFPVTEVLAVNENADTAIIRAKVPFTVKPLALNSDVYPGDGAWCYSDPLGRSSYFSKGMVNRFYVHGRRGTESSRMEVSTDWAPGSSGAAVVDVCGNAIGHVSEISSAGSPPRQRGTNQPAGPSPSAMIIFHSAARAADVLSLVKPSAK